MMNDLHNMEEQFKSAYSRFEEDPSVAVWENIQEELDKKSPRRRFIYWKRVSAIALFLLIGILLVDPLTTRTGSGNRNKVPVKHGEKILKENTELDKITNNSTKRNNPDDTYNNDVVSINNERNYYFLKKEVTRSLLVPEANDETEQVVLSQESIWALQKTENTYRSSMVFSLKRKDNSVVSLLDQISPKPDIEKKEPESPDNKEFFTPSWLLSALFSYDQIGYKLDSDDPLAVTNIKHREVHEPSFTGSLLLTRQLSKHWGLQSGISYTSTQIGISPQKMYALQLPGGDIAFKFISSTGYAYIKPNIAQPIAVGDSITTSDAKHILKHVSIPLNAKYNIGNKKLTVTPIAGVEANFITSAKVEVGVDLASSREIVTVNKLNGIRKFYWSATTGAEINYRVNKKVTAGIRPVYKHAFSPITKDNVVETFPRNFSIGAGITIKL